MKVVFKNSQGTELASSELTGVHGEALVTKEMLKEAGNKLIICFSQPVIDIHGYWTSELNQSSFIVPWFLKHKSAAQREMPFLAWVNIEGENSAAFMLTDLKDDAFLVSKLSQSDAIFEMEWTVVLSPETEPFRFLADFEKRPLPETVTAYRKAVLPEMPEFPEQAWDPVYCTWYAFHGAFTIPELERNAAAAREMGFKTFILDDGWSYDISKRLNPATLSEWYSENGEWQVSEKKMPDFGAHVKRVQAMGMNYVLWYTPFLVGNKTGIYRKLKQNGSILWESDDGSACADPKDSLIDSASNTDVLKIFKDYKLDGLKVDFIDFVHPEEERPRGRDAYARVKFLVSELRKIKPDALIEFRQHYTTPAMLSFGTNFRANDVPFDFVGNLHRCCQIRMILGDGVPVHADPVSFHPEESCVNVARHMISSLAGVPMISADLNTIAPKHRAVIQRFVQFYLDHKETFRNGHWTLHYEYEHLAWISVETDKEVIGTAVTSIPNMPLNKDQYLMNLSGNEYLSSVENIDSEGNKSEKLLPGGIAFRSKEA